MNDIQPYQFELEGTGHDKDGPEINTQEKL